MFEQLSNVPGIVAVVLALFAILALIITTDRYFYLHRSRVDTFELLRGLLNQLRAGRVKEAIANCDSKTGPVGEIFRTAIEHWNEGEASIRYAVEELVMILIPRLERNLKLLVTIANLTPIIGLLGTLVSLIRVFDSINLEFQGAQVISGDIKQALLCTAAGLLCSLICQLGHAVLVEKVNFLLTEMGKGAAEITYFLTHTQPPVENSSPDASRKG